MTDSLIEKDTAAGGAAVLVPANDEDAGATVAATTVEDEVRTGPEAEEAHIVASDPDAATDADGVDDADTAASGARDDSDNDDDDDEPGEASRPSPAAVPEADATTDALQLFLNEARRYPLLTAAEEV